MSIHWSPSALVLLAVTGVLVGSAPSTASAASVPATGANSTGCTNQAAKSNFHERSVSGPILPLQQFPAGVVSVPTWSSSFSTDGTSYPYTMVGTDPAAGSVTTHVPVELIPLRLEFQGTGCVLQDSNAVADIEASPLFTASADMHTGVTQYLDAIQRANFWATVSTVSPEYHLLLDPIAIPAVTLHVPASQGLTFDDPSCDPDCGIVGGNWLYRQILDLLGSLHVSPTTLAVFVPFNTLETDEDPNDCLVSCSAYDGYHYAALSSKNPHAINTFVMAEYIDDPEIPAPYDVGAYTLSHEILEWANDPFDNGGRNPGQAAFFGNITPAWTTPYLVGAGCLPLLEVADPLEGYGPLAVEAVGSSTKFALADAAFLSWFARQSPSTAYGGLYDAGGVLSTYSAAC